MWLTKKMAKCEFFEECIWSLDRVTRENYCEGKPKECSSHEIAVALADIYHRCDRLYAKTAKNRV